MQNEELFLRAISRAAEDFKRLAPQNIVLFHHNDADGLSSGAILAQAFERRGIRLRRYCLEKPYPEALQRVIQDPDIDERTLVVLADFGSGMLPELILLNRQRLPIFVLDHHTVEPASSPELTLVNCTSFGVPSDPGCSASSIAFLFAADIDALNRDLAPIAVVGAVGDGLIDSSGRLSGINARVAELATTQSLLEFRDGEYFICRPERTSVRAFVKEVNALGSSGYFRGGPDVAVKGLREGRGEAFVQIAGSAVREFEDAVAKLMQMDFLHRGKNVQWFELGKDFSAFGVKTVGLVCEEIIKCKLADPNLYLAGFQKIPDEVPGLGPLFLRQTKISMRLPAGIKDKVKTGKARSRAEILPEATRNVGGFVDACHPHAAATTIPDGKNSQLISELEAAALR
jgi:nanoRNase/pAp phosphatase (c-di-AMP/oligoRNAs hydrolase)